MWLLSVTLIGCNHSLESEESQSENSTESFLSSEQPEETNAEEWTEEASTEAPTANGVLSEAEFDAFMQTEFPKTFPKDAQQRYQMPIRAADIGEVTYYSYMLDVPSRAEGSDSVIHDYFIKLYSYDTRIGENKLVHTFPKSEYAYWMAALENRFYMLHLDDGIWYLCEIDTDTWEIKQRLCAILREEELFSHKINDDKYNDAWNIASLVYLHQDHVYVVADDFRTLKGCVIAEGDHVWKHIYRVWFGI